MRPSQRQLPVFSRFFVYGSLLLISGLIGMWLGVSRLRLYSMLNNRGIPATGKVLRGNSSQSKRGEYSQTVEFDDHNGTRHTVETRSGTTPLRTGTPVALIYAADNPADTATLSLSHDATRSSGWKMMIAGIVHCAAGVFFFYKAR